MGVEASMREAGPVHDLGDARASVAGTPNGAGGRRHDAVVGGFLTARDGSSRRGGSHMMTIIRQREIERKGPR
jgi:hypothetical protein